jgi:hypothetical protein
MLLKASPVDLTSRQFEGMRADLNPGSWSSHQRSPRGNVEPAS